MAAPVPATKDKVSTIMQVLNARRDMFREVLPKYLTPERLFRVAQIAMSKNSSLLNCTTASLVVAMMDAAKSGLEPNGKDAALVPYGQECQFQPMYQGLIKQAISGGAAKKIAARVVHSNDHFKIWYDPEPHVEHEPALEDEGEIIGAYAYAILPDGELHVEYMNKRQLDHIRNKAKAKSFSPWQTDEEEMYRKTPVKRLFKYLPVPNEVEYAVAVDNQHETGKGRQDMPVLEVVPEQAKSRTEEIKDDLKRRGRPPKSQDAPATEPPTPTPAEEKVSPQGGTDIPTAITPETVARIEKVCREKDIDIAMICQDAEVSALSEMTENEGTKVADFYEKA